jgi:hypothetical protein
VLITRARDEYYPFYDPKWDAPEWVRPPLSDEVAEATEEEEEEDEDIDRVMMEDHPKPVPARDYLDDVSPSDTAGAQGLQDAVAREGDGWDDLD